MGIFRKKSIRLNVGESGDAFLTLKLDQTYDFIDVLSLKLPVKNLYRTFNSEMGILAGRCLSNNSSVGVENVKISLFIPKDQDNIEQKIANAKTDIEKYNIKISELPYPY